MVALVFAFIDADSFDRTSDAHTVTGEQKGTELGGKRQRPRQPQNDIPRIWVWSQHRKTFFACVLFHFCLRLGSGAQGLRHRPGSIPLTLEQPKLLSAVESCSRISSNQLPGADILYKTPNRMLMSTTFSHLSHFFSFKR